MKIDENTWKMFQHHLGYSGEEMAKFRADPRNAEVLLKAPELMNKTIVAEVVESHGCNSQHKVGDKFLPGRRGKSDLKALPQQDVSLRGERTQARGIRVKRVILCWGGSQ